MSGVEGIIMEIISMLENMFMVCGVFCVPISRNRKYFIGGGLFLVGLCIGDAFLGFDEFTMLLFRVILSPIIVSLWTRGKLFRKLSIFVCSIMYLHMPYLCIDLMFSGFFGKPMTVLKLYGLYRMIRGGLTIIIAGMLAYRLRKISGYENILKSLQTKYFLTGSICCLAASLVQYYIEDMSVSVYANTGQVICVTVCMVIVSAMFYALGVGVVILDLLRKKYQAESKLKDEYLQISREYVREVRENARETRKMRHDLQAHTTSLRYYMEHKEYQKAEEYLAAMCRHADKMIRKMPSVNHEIVDAVLLEAQIRSENFQISWKVEGSIPSEISIGDFDLCTIFSNLLANSVEACEKLPAEQRYIHLEIRHLGSHLVIEITNPVKDSVDIEKLGSITTKADDQNHGFGIENVKAAVEKNHGELFFEEIEEVFLTRIILNW